MSFPNKPLTSSLRHPSIGASLGSSGQSPALVARISEKRAELENLKQLRDLSAGLATQMEALEQKLATLSDGTEGVQSAGGEYIGFINAERGSIAVAAVLANWHNVLRAINMASSKIGPALTYSEAFN